jgi:hypothetical protein
MRMVKAVAFDRPPRGFNGLTERLAERRMVARWDHRCPLCGGADALRLGSCLCCAGRSGEKLIFLRPPPTQADRLNNLRLVRSLLPPHSPEFDVGLVADGHLALAAVPEQALGNLEVALAERGLGVRFLSARWWGVASMPPFLVVSLALLVMAGVGAWSLHYPWVALLAAGATVAASLIAQLYLRYPLTQDRDRDRWLEPDDERVIVETLTSLPRGRAKSLLTDLVRLGRLLHARARLADDRTVMDDTAALMVVAAEVATDLVHTRELAEALTRREAIRGSDPTEPDAQVRLIASAEQLEGLLLNAIGQLGGGNRRLLHQGGSGNRLSFLVHEIDRGRSAYRGAFLEIEELLRERG